MARLAVRIAVMAGLLLRVAVALAVPCSAFFGNSCFIFVPGSETEATAEQTCAQQLGGHLASIHSPSEDNFVSNLVDPHHIGGITAWIGGFAQNGFCSGPNATYSWVDGTAWNFENWRSSTGEPNCTGVPGCIQFWPNTNGTLSGWNDAACNATLDGFVCEFAAPASEAAPAFSTGGVVVLGGLLMAVGVVSQRMMRTS